MMVAEDPVERIKSLLENIAKKIMRSQIKTRSFTYLY